MARNPKPTKKKSQDRRPRAATAGGRPRRGRPKFCVFCREHATWVDYKDVGLLRRYMSDRGRIKSRGATGTCAQHQRDVATAIKTARELALLPYSVRTAGTEARSGRGGDRRGGAPTPAAGASAAQSEGSRAPGGDADASGADDDAFPAETAPSGVAGDAGARSDPTIAAPA